MSLLHSLETDGSDMLSIPLPDEAGYTVYSKTGCVYCDRVKALLEYEQVTVVDCDSFLLNDREWFLRTMRVLCGRDYQMFPMVFHHGRFLGGYDDTKEYYQSSLVNMLEDF